MKLILKEKIKGLGDVNDVKEVSDGYARNFLLPGGKAIVATPAAIAEALKAKSSVSQKAESREKDATELEKQLEGITLEFSAEMSDKGHFFGSIAEKDIVAKLKEQDIKVTASKIKMDHIKEPGDYKVEIATGSNHKATITVVAKAN